MRIRSRVLLGRARSRLRGIGIAILSGLTLSTMVAVMVTPPARAASAKPRPHFLATSSTPSPARPSDPDASGHKWPFGTPSSIDASVVAGTPGLSYAAAAKARRYQASPPPPQVAITLAPTKATAPPSPTAAPIRPGLSASLLRANLSLPPANYTFAAPSVEYLPRTTTAPVQRGWASMAYDSYDNIDVLFGGTSGATGNALNDTWTWNGTAWTQESPTTSPAARQSANMAYLPGTGMVLFGGDDNSGNSLGDTWVYNGTTWSQLTGPGPGAREDFSMDYDANLGKIVLFGGIQLTGGVQTGIDNDTWTFNGTAWTQLSPTASPTARTGAAMAYDPGLSETVLFGGLNGSEDGDTWSFDGTTWTQLSPSSSPPARQDMGLAWDPTLNSLLLYGGYSNGTGTYYGDEWAFDGANWDQGGAYVSGGPRQWPDLAQAPTATPSVGEMMLFGGATSSLDYGDTDIVDYLGVGQRRGYAFDTKTLDDQMSIGINMASRDVMVTNTDFSIASAGHGVSLTRTYNSRSGGDFSMGPDWTMNTGADVFASPLPNGDIVLLGQAAGDEEHFTKTSATCAGSGSVAFSAPIGVDADLCRSAGGSLSLTYHASQEVLGFNSTGQETSDTDRNGLATTFTYNSDGTTATVTDTEGRVTNFTYSGGLVQRITDPAGQPYTYGYTAGVLTSYTDPAGATTTYAYDSANDLTSITDPNGNVTQIAYDTDDSSIEAGSLTLGYGSGVASTTTYDHADPPSGVTGAFGDTDLTDPDGHVSTYVWNSAFQVIKTTDARNNTTSATYNSDANLTSTTDGLSNTTNLAYNPAGELLQKLTDPAQVSGDTAAAQNYLYDFTAASGIKGYQYLASSSVDPQGNCTAYIYDPAGNVVKTSPGQATNSSGNCDNTLGTTVYEYARQGDTLDGASVSCPGAKAGEICFTKDANANQTDYGYDANGNVTSLSPPSPQGATTYALDALSRPKAVTDGKGQRSLILYDPDGRVDGTIYGGASACGSSGTISAVGSLANTISAGNSSLSVSPVTVGDVMMLAVEVGTSAVSVTKVSGGGANWRRIQAFPDASANRSVEIWAGAIAATGSSTISLTYSGSVSGINIELAAQEFSAGLGSPTVWAYDASGVVSNPSSSTITFPTLTPSGSGELYFGYARAANTAGAGSTSGFSYDVTVNSNLVTYDASVSSAVSPTGTQSPAGPSSAVGVLMTAGDGSRANCTTSSFDPDGNMTAQVDSTGTTAVSYDALNRPIEKDVPTSPTNACSGYSGMRYTYDAASNLTSYCDSGGIVAYTYDSANNLTSLAEPGGNCTSVPVVQPCTTFNNYDANERLASIWSANTPTTAAETLPSGTGSVVNISYDNAGDMNVMSFAKGLTGCASSGSNCLSNNGYFYYQTVGGVTYDRNILQAKSDNFATGAVFDYYYDSRNQLSEAKQTTGGTADYLYAYDANGNRCALAASCASPTYSYNADNELTSGPAGSYSYDANGNETASPTLSSLTLNNQNQTTSITPSGGSAESFSYAGQGQAGRVTAGAASFANGLDDQVMEQTTSGTTIYFTRLPDGQLFSMRVGSSNYYYIYDYQGTILGLIDSSGNRVATYSYDPYGQVLSSSGTESAVNPYGFQGGYLDSTTGMVKFGQRYYDPTVGRWTQLDPEGGGYTYAVNDPVSATDITGLSSNSLSQFFNYLNSLTPSAEAAVESYLKALNASKAAENAYGGPPATETVLAANHGGSAGSGLGAEWFAVGIAGGSGVVAATEGWASISGAYAAGEVGGVALAGAAFGVVVVAVCGLAVLGFGVYQLATW